ncbi:aconitase X swivel domain-containing protein [Chloroflexota bacterium]
MSDITIKCRKLLGGIASGEAMVSHTAISPTGEIDETTGVVRVKGHELEGMCIAGKILIYPESKGSAGIGLMLKTLAYLKLQPSAIIVNKMPDHATIQGIILANIPTVYEPEHDVLDIINTGDKVEVNANESKIIIRR